MKSLLIYLAAVVSLLLSCSDMEMNHGEPSYNYLRKNTSAFLYLNTFDSCSELEARVKESLINNIMASLEEQRNRLIDIKTNGDQQSIMLPEVSDDAQADESSGPSEHTGTNNQVEGVQEADIYKTNGIYTYLLSGSSIRVLKNWPASELSEIASIDLEGTGIEMFLSEANTLFVAYFSKRDGEESYSWYPWYWDQEVKIKSFDVSTPEAPSLMDEKTIRGQYVTMRRIGDEIKIIQNSWQSNPIQNAYITIWENGQTISLETFNERASALLEEKKLEVESLNLATILQAYEGSQEPIHQESINCQKIYGSEALDSWGFTKISSYNLASQTFNQSILLSPTNLIHGSLTSLYTAISRRGMWDDNSYESRTFVHRFDLTNSDIAYLGSGVVRGYLNDQFSMDEKDGILRLALTETEGQGWRGETVNRVATLQLSEGELVLLGETPALAEGERIYSARFSGDKAFVVTFRQVDPLFTIDLSNPEEPKVIGELKVPGYSTYIHMIGENHLLTVGLENWSPKISLFDVSDFANPKELDTYRFDTGGWSESVFNHKAFTYYASRGLLAIPYGYWDSNVNSRNWYDHYKSQLRIFNIDLAQGISLKGDIPMNDLYQSNDPGWAYWWYGAQVRRSFFADDYVYSISTFGVKAYHLDQLDLEVSRATFY